MQTEILAGNRRKFTVTFQVPDESGALTDPTTVTFYRRRVDGSDAGEQWVAPDPAISHDSTGVYSLTIDFDDPGVFAVGAQGTGTCKAYDEARIEIEPVRAKPAP